MNNITEIVLIAFGLSMDSLAVSLTGGCFLKKFRVRKALLLAFSFGFFQGIMPILGWLAGSFFSSKFANFDHWIAFIILLFLGIKMIADSGRKEENKGDFFSPGALVLMGIATSIDAFGVGITFAFLGFNILAAVLIIAAVTALISFGGVFVGCRFNSLLPGRLEIAGGAVIIFIGMKILIEHLSSGG